MLKEDVVKYVMETPYNTNRQVLKGMLDEFEEDSGSSKMPNGVATILEYDTTYGENEFRVTQQGNDKFVIIGGDMYGVTDRVVGNEIVTVYVPQQGTGYLIPTEHTGYYTLTNETPK